jgi:hypothetical protein
METPAMVFLENVIDGEWKRQRWCFWKNVIDGEWNGAKGVGSMRTPMP